MNNRKFISTKNLIIVGLFASILCILAPCTIPTPIISISIAPFLIVLTGMVLGSHLGVLAVLIYLLLGFAGLPVFSNHSAGPGMLFGATGGFLIGYVAMVFIVGLGKGKKIIFNFILTAIGVCILYILGFTSLRLVTSSWNFVPGMTALFVKDLLVSIAAIFLGREILKRIGSMVTPSEQV